MCQYGSNPNNALCLRIQVCPKNPGPIILLARDEIETIFFRLVHGRDLDSLGMI